MPNTIQRPEITRLKSTPQWLQHFTVTLYWTRNLNNCPTVTSVLYTYIRRDVFRNQMAPDGSDDGRWYNNNNISYTDKSLQRIIIILYIFNDAYICVITSSSLAIRYDGLKAKEKNVQSNSFEKRVIIGPRGVYVFWSTRNTLRPV